MPIGPPTPTQPSLPPRLGLICIPPTPRHPPPPLPQAPHPLNGSAFLGNYTKHSFQECRPPLWRKTEWRRNADIHKPLSKGFRVALGSFLAGLGKCVSQGEAWCRGGNRYVDGWEACKRMGHWSAAGNEQLRSLAIDTSPGLPETGNQCRHHVHVQNALRGPGFCYRANHPLSSATILGHRAMSCVR